MKKTELIISGLERLKKDYADGTFGEKWISDAIEEMKLMGKCIKSINSTMSRNLTVTNKITKVNDALSDYDGVC